MASILPDDEPLDISRAQMTLLMMESYKKSSSSAEEMLCLKEVAKMNGLYADKSPTTQINVLNIEQNIKKLEMLSDEELLKLAGHSQDLFKQIEHVPVESVKATEDSIDAEYSEVDEED